MAIYADDTVIVSKNYDFSYYDCSVIIVAYQTGQI